MNTFTPLGASDGTPTALDVATRVETQDSILDNIANAVADGINARVDVQEIELKPIYRTLVKDIQSRIKSNAEVIAPVGRRVITSLKARTATTGSMLDNVAEQAAIAGVVLNDDRGIPTPVTTPTGVGSDPTPVTPPLTPQPRTSPGFPSPIPPVTPPQPQVQIPPQVPVPVAPPPRPVVPRSDVVLVNPQQPGCEVPEIPGVWMKGDPITDHPWWTSFGIACPVVPGTTPTPIPTPPPTPPVAPVPPPPPVQCIPEPLPPVSDVHYPGVALAWCDFDPCAKADAELNRLRTTLPANVTNNSDAGDLLGGFLTYSGSLASLGGWSALKRIVPGDVVDHLSVGAGETLGRIAIGIQTADSILTDLAPTGLSDKKTATALLARIGAGNLVAGETGIPIDYLLTGERYLFQYSNPQFIPEQSELDSAWLHNRLTDTQWRCLTLAHGNIPECRKPVLLSQQRSLEILELIHLYRIGHIKSKEELYNRCRRLGVLDDKVVDEYLIASLQLPTASTLQHYNIHDVFDPNKLGLAEMRAEYEEVKNLAELYEAGGLGKYSIFTRDGREIEVDQAWLDFLGSYDEASPTQTYNMLHRLRPGRTHLFAQFVPGKKAAELRTILPGADIQDTPDGKGCVVTPRPVTTYEVAKNLKEKDYNPIWRDKLSAISYNVIGRIDLRRLYGIGAFGTPVGIAGFFPAPGNTWVAVKPAEIELVQRYMDSGYTEIDATLLAYYTATEYDNSKKQKVRGNAVTRICTAFKLGVIDRAEALKRMVESVGDEKEAAYRLEQCELDHKLSIVKATIAAIRKRFLNGEILERDARVDMFTAGIDRVRINELIDLWTLQLRKKDKELTASQMCQYYADGSLTRKDFKTRLVNIGFEDADADRIIRHCELGELAKSAKIRDRQINATKREKQRIMDQAAKDEKERIRAQEERMLRFLKFRTEKHLLEWWQDGTITEGEIRTTLLAKGASNEDVERWVSRNNPGRKRNDDSGGGEA